MKYTGQSPPLSESELDSFLNEMTVARLCTNNKNGTIHAIPMSYIYTDGKFIIPSATKSRKVKNIKRNNKVTLLIDTVKQPVKGVMIYGECELNFDNVREAIASVYSRGLPLEQAEKLSNGLMKLTEWVLIEVYPQKIVSFDAAKDTEFLKAFEG